jgi:hypothetical protein
LFKPGDKVPVSGVYRVTHDRHRMPHKVFAFDGDEFPACKKCGNLMRFTPRQAATHIESDLGFFKDGANSMRKTDSGTKPNIDVAAIAAPPLRPEWKLVCTQ